MGPAKKTVRDLKVGETGTICCLKDAALSLKLLEMGCVPGTEVKLCHKAPLGDPICIMVDHYKLSLRLDEAATIQLR